MRHKSESFLSGSLLAALFIGTLVLHGWLSGVCVIAAFVIGLKEGSGS